MAVVLPASRDEVGRLMLARNDASASFFAEESERLAAVCRLVATRFQRGGRLLAFGSGQCASDAQHIAVEFLHPVLVGKRALPALDLSTAYEQCLPALIRKDDIVVGFGPPGGDARVDAMVRAAMEQGAFSIALPGTAGDYAIAAPSPDPFVHQEVIEILYHTLWETVHLFLEREPLNESAGAASFLYPFLGTERGSSAEVLAEAAASIRGKAALTGRLREEVAVDQAAAIVDAAAALRKSTDGGGTVLCFGNGGSATDATDLALDLCASPKGHPAVRALSLASDAATLTAIANDIGADALFSRQLIACGRPGDVAVALSTSGGSANIMAALREARARGLITVAFVGYGGGEVLRRRLADHVIVVGSDQIPRVQEVQASIYHVMIDLLHATPRCT
jgi:D-sedoheptulose 7-phosphate isomerase